MKMQTITSRRAAKGKGASGHSVGKRIRVKPASACQILKAYRVSRAQRVVARKRAIAALDYAREP